MPLTRERESVFQGRAWRGSKQWHVIDPVREPEVALAEWRSNFAARNEAWWKTAIRWVVGVVVFLLIGLGLGSAAAAIAAWFPFAATIASVVAVLGSLIGIGLAVSAGAYIIRVPPPRRDRVVGVVPIHRSVADWATDATPVEQLWAVAMQVDRLVQAVVARESWHDSWDNEYEERPAELIEDVIEPVLKEQYDAEFRRLEEVAGRNGFDIPDYLRWTDAPPKP